MKGINITLTEILKQFKFKNFFKLCCKIFVYIYNNKIIEIFNENHRNSDFSTNDNYAINNQKF
jgi:hypothetical protein